MNPNPDKFLYVYLQDIGTNPKLCFELHKGPLPKGRHSYARTAFDSLQRQEALEDIRAIEDVGFYVMVRLLLERPLAQGRYYALIIYPHTEGRNQYIDMDRERYHGTREGGDFYTFLPIRPFDTNPETINTEENSMDPVLWMRAGRIVANALLE